MNRSFCAPLACVLGILSVSGLHAQSVTSAVVQLPDVLVTPMRSESTSFDLPVMTGAIDLQEIQLRHLARTTPEILNEIPGVLVQKTAHGQGSPFIRGFTGFRTLFLVDGIRLNNATFREGPNQYWNTVDAYSLDRLEFVKGPSSVLYGSDAIGGTVNALTRSPFQNSGDTVGGRTYYRFSSAEDSHVFRGEGHVIAGNRFAAQFGMTVKDFGDLRSGSGRQHMTGYDETDMDARIDYVLSPDVLLSLRHQNVTQDDAWRTHKTVFGQSFHGTDVGRELIRTLDQERQLTYAVMEIVDLNGLADEVLVTLSHHHQGEDQFRTKKNGDSDLQGTDVDTLGASVQALTATDRGEWVYGIEVYRDSVDSFRQKLNDDGSVKSRSIQGPVGDDSDYDSIGLYVQDTLQISDSLRLIPGARYSVAEADVGRYQDPATGAEASLRDDWEALTGSVRALYELSDTVNLFAGVSQGFRAPNLSDLTRLDTARSDEVETPTPGLEPEEFLAYEIGFKASTEKHSIECAYYYTDIDDMIVRTPTDRFIDGDREVTKKNSGQGFVHGLELNAATWFTPAWMLWGNATWMDGEVDTFPTSHPVAVIEPIDRLMPLTLNGGLRFDPAADYWMEAVVNAADKQDNLSTRDTSDTQRIPPGGTPGYAVLTVRAGLDIAEHCSLTAAVENVADKNYRVHGSGLNEPGRNLVMGFEYTF